MVSCGTNFSGKKSVSAGYSDGLMQSVGLAVREAALAPESEAARISVEARWRFMAVICFV